MAGVESRRSSEQKGKPVAQQIRVSPEELRHLGTSFRGQSDSVSQLMSSLDGQMRGVDWAGESAARFRVQWEDEFRPTLVNLSAALDEASGRLAERAEAAEQYDQA